MNTIIETSAAESLARVRNEIAAACVEARREPASVTLIAVSKTHRADVIAPVIAAGQRVFGEDRVQEAKAKWPALCEAHPELELHLIRPLQPHKTKEAVALFDADERGLRDRKRVRRDSRAGRYCDLWRARKKKPRRGAGGLRASGPYRATPPRPRTDNLSA